MTLAIDIDDTLIVSEKVTCNKCGRITYKNPIPILNEIKQIKQLYKKGHTIILYTGRNWDCYDLTVKQLKKFKIKYHELVMGKPQGIYVDRDAKLTLEDICY